MLLVAGGSSLVTGPDSEDLRTVWCAESKDPTLRQCLQDPARLQSGEFRSRDIWVWQQPRTD